MTTIVVDRLNNTMYSDSRVTYCGTHSKVKKIFKEKLFNGRNVIIGLTGTLLLGHKLKNYLTGVGFPDGDHKIGPTFTKKEQEEESFEVLVLYHDNTLIIYDMTMRPLEVIDNIYTAGSGGVLAKTIIQYQIDTSQVIDIKKAIKTVSKIDIYTDDDVKKIKLNGEK